MKTRMIPIPRSPINGKKGHGKKIFLISTAVITPVAVGAAVIAVVLTRNAKDSNVALAFKHAHLKNVNATELVLHRDNTSSFDVSSLTVTPVTMNGKDTYEVEGFIQLAIAKGGWVQDADVTSGEYHGVVNASGHLSKAQIYDGKFTGKIVGYIDNGKYVSHNSNGTYSVAGNWVITKAYVADFTTCEFQDFSSIDGTFISN